jgi:DNA polymerase-4
LEKSGFKGYTLTLKIKFNDFTQKTRSISEDHSLTTLKEILPLAKELLKEVDITNHPIRLIGLSVSNPWEELPSQRYKQLSFKFK